ncbi:MAG: hypothetical protein GQ574_24030 [Crocinitomix sp.]|nr:hypothetical protein [Crocinitomix sp.]
MKRIVLFFLVLSPFFATSQFETKADYLHGVMLRGKIYAGPTASENQFGLLWTLGGEVRFFKHHSIGVDWVSFRNSYEQESLSPMGYYENNGTYNVKIRKYALIDYRFYFPVSGTPVMPYINVLCKMGNQNEWFNDDVDPDIIIPYSYSTKFKEYGFAIGSHFGFKKTRMGADISLGVIRAYRSIRYGQQYVQDSDWKPHMRVNLYFNLFRVRKRGQWN